LSEYNGYLKIKTKLDNKEIDKDVAELENKINKLHMDNEIKNQESSSLQAEINNYEQLAQKAEEYRQQIKRLKADRQNMLGNNPSLAVSSSPEYAKLNSQLDVTKQKYAQITNEVDKQASKIDKVYIKLAKIKAKQSENNAKISEYKRKIESINTSHIQNSLNSVGANIQKQIGSIGKMALAVIGVRTAWGLVRSAISMVSQYNSQVSADFEYMRYCIASLLAPAVQGLIKLLYTVLSYVNAIANAWFGINLFGNASVKNFKKMQSSAGSTAKSAKEIKKSLQGFDEMNILQDNSDSSSGGGGGASTPSMDLSGIQGEVPKWMKWIIDNKDLLLSIIAGILAGIIALKLGLGGIKALGIGILVAGVVYAIQALIAYLKDPSWMNFGKIVSGIGVALLGLGLIIGNLPLAVTGAVVAILGIVIANWEKIKAFLQGCIDWLTGKSEWIHSKFGDFIGSLYDGFVNILQGALAYLDTVFTSIKGIFDGLIKFIKGVFTGDWKLAFEGLKDIVFNIFNIVWARIKMAINTITNLITATLNALISIFSKVGQTIINLFNNIATKVPETISSKFKSVINAVLSAVQAILNTPIKAINGLIGAVNQLPGVNIGKLNTFSFPRLAKGGVITQPTQAIIGEAGKEAVVPLENNLEWLDILADKLANKIGAGGGSYIINMDSRAIQRGIAKRQNELAFATNGGK